ncbi:hypothetical protein A3Q56_03608 [Intoshia linei]|uniref:Uncharacterized protein n=1 Tax=Intoshia linei TaxID=1819745 RepID=A0A177B348_9BILA|nr:hypothetical protein A3Q56_03608 [Intoshia linei]
MGLLNCCLCCKIRSNHKNSSKLTTCRDLSQDKFRNKNNAFSNTNVVYDRFLDHKMENTKMYYIINQETNQCEELTKNEPYTKTFIRGTTSICNTCISNAKYNSNNENKITNLNAKQSDFTKNNRRLYLIRSQSLQCEPYNKQNFMSKRNFNEYTNILNQDTQENEIIEKYLSLLPIRNENDIQSKDKSYQSPYYADFKILNHENTYQSNVEISKKKYIKRNDLLINQELVLIKAKSNYLAHRISNLEKNRNTIINKLETILENNNPNNESSNLKKMKYKLPIPFPCEPAVKNKNILSNKNLKCLLVKPLIVALAEKRSIFKQILTVI